MSKLRIELNNGTKHEKSKDPIGLPMLKMSNKKLTISTGLLASKRTDYLSDEKILLKQAKALLAAKNGHRWLRDRGGDETTSPPVSTSESSSSSPKDRDNDESSSSAGGEATTTVKKTKLPHLVDRGGLMSPRIRLKLLDVKNLVNHPTGVSLDTCDPTDENTLRQLGTHVHASVIKRYDVIIPRRLELPVINSVAIAAAASVAAARCNKPPHRHHGIHPSLMMNEVVAEDDDDDDDDNNDSDDVDNDDAFQRSDNGVVDLPPLKEAAVDEIKPEKIINWFDSGECFSFF